MRALGVRVMGVTLLGLGWLAAAEARWLWFAAAGPLATAAALAIALVALALAVAAVRLVIRGGEPAGPRHDPVLRCQGRVERIAGALGAAAISAGIILAGEASRSWAAKGASATFLLLLAGATALIAGGSTLVLRSGRSR